ncbi:PGAP1-like protein-domain-containing protein [Phlebopus sp. FC_14]|nr:PGAP1-like protein-domain-containing protein [Phlebopus sp. FC_14]
MLSTTKTATTILGLFAVLAVYIVYLAASDIPRFVSTQGCRMSWMSPSYLLQANFNTSWTPLAGRYSLWLYREVGWEPNQAMGVPVLFIPGNAGSSHQVRSIASSAARQYFSSPFVVSNEFTGRKMKPLDVYAVEFNEDLSAFHGPTLDSQIAYTSAAIRYILSHYLPDTQVIIMGHSMGGIVGTALLPSPHISVLITMSTPHTLPPARFDARIEEIYERNSKVLDNDNTPILCGWRVARAALELGGAKSPEERRDVHLGVPGAVKLDEGRYEVLQDNTQLVLRNPRATGTYLIPVPNFADERKSFVLYASRGSVSNVAPHHPSGLRVSVQFCIPRPGSESPDEASPVCTPLPPTTLKLLPSPILGKPFPVPDEGSDESEGVVFFEGGVPRGVEGWVGINIEAGESGEGWIVAGFDDRPIVTSEIGMLRLVFGGARISLPRPDHRALTTRINVPLLQTNALLVYRLVAPSIELSRCADTLFPPLLWYSSHPSESHFSPLTSEPVYLHSHGSAPYVSRGKSVASPGLNFAIYSTSLSCYLASELFLSIDWWATAGRIGTRYPTTLLSWCIGVASLLLFHLWDAEGHQGLDESLRTFVRTTAPKLMGASVVLSLLPLGPNYYLGLGSGIGLASAAMAILLVCVASGMVCVSWWLLLAFMWPMKVVTKIVAPRRPEDAGLRRSTVISMFLILLMISLFIPWQVAFLGCWFVQLFNCASTRGRALKPYPGSTPTVTSTPTESIPLREHPQDNDTLDGKVDDRKLLGNQVSNRFSSSDGVCDGGAPIEGITAHSLPLNDHVLLLMTWLLPLVGPVLVVWVRTLQTAGYTTPFNGDHNIFKITPVLCLIDYLGRGQTPEVKRMGRTSLRWVFVVLAGVAFMVGGRKPYLVYDAANVLIALLLLCKAISCYLS